VKENRFSRSQLNCVFVLAILICSQNDAIAKYKFVNVVYSDSFRSLGYDYVTGVAISDGNILLRAMSSDLKGAGLFLWKNGAVTPVVEQGAGSEFGENVIYYPPTMSGDSIAFTGWFRDTDRFTSYLNDGHQTSVIAQDGGVTSGGTISRVSTQLRGSSIGQRITYADATEEIILSYEGQTQTILKTGSVTPLGMVEQIKSFENNGLATSATARVSGHDGDVLFHMEGDTLKTIAKKGDLTDIGPLDQIGWHSVAQSKVAFIGYGYNDDFPEPRGIFVGDGQSITTVVKQFDPSPLGPFYLFHELSFDGSRIAFGTTLNFIDYGAVYVKGLNGPLTPVIQSGDMLFDAQVFGTGFGSHNLDPNGSGNLIFTYSFVDGRSGTALAIEVPEPSDSHLLWCLTACTIFLSRLRHRGPSC
jgi:hypothetical protein